MYLAVFIILFSIAAYMGASSYPHQSAYFPRFIIIFLAFLGCVMLAKEIRGRTKRVDSKEADPKDTGVRNREAFRKVSMMIVSSMIFLLALSKLGFFSVTLVYLPVMIWLLGIRKPSTIILSTGFVVFFIFLIFRVFLKVPFPEGLLF
jgi:hypothetical protein